MSSYRRYKKSNNSGNQYVVYNPHIESTVSPRIINKNIIVTSIDPGVKNCGVYVNCFNTETKEHTSILLMRLDFSKTDNKYVECIKQFDDLEKTHQYFSKSHYIVIEAQMTISYINTRMGQNIITYFTTKLKNRGNLPHIIELTSQAKTRLLGCPKGMKKQEYKRWCKQKAISFINERKNTDHESVFSNKIKSVTKGDDMGDTVCQMYAWMMIMEKDFKDKLCSNSSNDFIIES